MTSPTKLDQSTMQRLTFIRLLHQQAVEQARLPHPLKITSILTFDDAVEQFLILASDHLNGPSPHQVKFLQYWEKLHPDNLQDGVELSMRAAMGRLHEARNHFKHKGIRPSIETIEEARTSVQDFFEDNTLKVFKVDFAQISMADLVPQDAVRVRIKEAVAVATGGDRKHGVGLLALAFDDLFREHVGYVGRHGSPFSFGPTIPGWPNSTRSALQQLRGERQPFSHAAEGLGKHLDAVTAATATMQQALRVLAIGVEYYRFQRFDALTPRVVHYSPSNVDLQHHPLSDPAEEEFEFCERFVIEVALRLAEISALTIKPSWLADEVP